MNFLPSSPQIIMLVAMGVMIWVLWRRSHKHFGSGGTAHSPIKRFSKLEEDRELALADAPAEVNRWQVEMHELARDLKGELDTRIAILQILLRQADQTAARLRGLGLGLGESLDPLAEIERWQPGDAASPNRPTHHPLAARILALAEEGKSPAEIAHQTGLPIGEVEIALSLREQT
jgi:hypothetical protein